jgi:multidrug transporter EmrE-like cation transporter
MTHTDAPAHVVPPESSRLAEPPPGLFLNPYFQILLGSLLVTASELLLKKGATATAGLAGAASWTGVAALGSWWTWAGIVTYVASFASWLYVLKYVPLGVAFALVNAAHVFVPIGAWLFLREPISLQRWVGIGLIVCGILLIARQAAAAEEKL